MAVQVWRWIRSIYCTVGSRSREGKAHGCLGPVALPQGIASNHGGCARLRLVVDGARGGGPERS